jgi:hypothetical protein
MSEVLDELVRAALDAQPWKDIYEMLTAYACMLVRQHVWRGELGGPVPGGREGEDFASEAIIDVYDGTREWNPSKQPDLAAHLRGIVKSKVSNATGLSENKKERRQLEEQEEEGTHCDPDDAFFWAFLGYVDDDPLLQQILECYYDGCMQRADVAARLNLSESDITNARKRLSRRLTAFQLHG